MADKTDKDDSARDLDDAKPAKASPAKASVEEKARGTATPGPEVFEEDEDDDDDDDDVSEEDVAQAAEASAKAKAAKTRASRDPADTKVVAEDKRPSPYGPIAHLAFVVVAAIAVYSFVSVSKEGELRRRCTPTCILRPTYSGYERRAPSFTLKDTSGHDVSLASYRGKVVVLNFWTKTCGPCVEEMPEIADLAKILKPMSDVAVITVSTDDTAQEALDTLKSVLKEPTPPFPVLMDPDAKVVRGVFGTSLYPETWIIDKDGVIRERFDGAREWSSSTVVEMVNHIRGGGYCPVQARDGKFVGESVHVCDGMSGG